MPICCCALGIKWVCGYMLLWRYADMSKGLCAFGALCPYDFVSLCQYAFMVLRSYALMFLCQKAVWVLSTVIPFVSACCSQSFPQHCCWLCLTAFLLVLRLATERLRHLSGGRGGFANPKAPWANLRVAQKRPPKSSHLFCKPMASL